MALLSRRSTNASLRCLVHLAGLLRWGSDGLESRKDLTDYLVGLREGLIITAKVEEEALSEYSGGRSLYPSLSELRVSTERLLSQPGRVQLLAESTIKIVLSPSLKGEILFSCRNSLAK